MQSKNYFSFRSFWQARDFARPHSFLVVTSGIPSMSPFFFEEANIPSLSERNASQDWQPWRISYPTAFYPDNVQLTVFCDPTYSAYKRFMSWKNAIISDGNLAYYVEYAADLTIMALDLFGMSVGMTATMTGCYPTNIGELRYSSKMMNEYMTFTCTLFTKEVIIG